MEKRTVYRCDNCGTEVSVPADYMGTPKCKIGCKLGGMVEQKEKKRKVKVKEKLPVVKFGDYTGAFRKIAKGLTIERDLVPDADCSQEWWQLDFDENESSWNDVGSSIHHREVELVGDEGINEPGKYVQTAIVLRNDGIPYQVFVVTGKITEIYNFN